MKINKQITIKRSGEGGVALNQVTGQYYRLNKTALFILSELKATDSLAGITVEDIEEILKATWQLKPPIASEEAGKAFCCFRRMGIIDD